MNEQSVFPEWKSFLGTANEEGTEGVLTKVVKRSGDIASYDRRKIEAAIGKAIPVNAWNTVWNIDASEIDTFFKNSAAKVFQTFRERDACQIFT